MSALHAQPWIFLRETAAMLTSIPSLDANFTTPLSETAPPALCVFKLSKNGSDCLPSPSDPGGEEEEKEGSGNRIKMRRVGWSRG